MGVVSCVVFLAVTRRWRPVVFLAVVMFGELAAFLTIAAVVKRPRPDVPHLDSRLPTSALERLAPVSTQDPPEGWSEVACRIWVPRSSCSGISPASPGLRGRDRPRNGLWPGA